MKSLKNTLMNINENSVEVNSFDFDIGQYIEIDSLDRKMIYAFVWDPKSPSSRVEIISTNNMKAWIEEYWDECVADEAEVKNILKLKTLQSCDFQKGEVKIIRIK